MPRKTHISNTKSTRKQDSEMWWLCDFERGWRVSHLWNRVNWAAEQADERGEMSWLGRIRGVITKNQAWDSAVGGQIHQISVRSINESHQMSHFGGSKTSFWGQKHEFGVKIMIWACHFHEICHFVKIVILKIQQNVKFWKYWKCVHSSSGSFSFSENSKNLKKRKKRTPFLTILAKSGILGLNPVQRALEISKIWKFKK